MTKDFRNAAILSIITFTPQSACKGGYNDEGKDQRRYKEKTQIIIAKHRNGETKDIDMVFRSEQVRFMEPDDTLVARASIPSAMNTEFE